MVRVYTGTNVAHAVAAAARADPHRLRRRLVRVCPGIRRAARKARCSRVSNITVVSCRHGGLRFGVFSARQMLEYAFRTDNRRRAYDDDARRDAQAARAARFVPYAFIRQRPLCRLRYRRRHTQADMPDRRVCPAFGTRQSEQSVVRFAAADSARRGNSIRLSRVVRPKQTG
ncbi:hypothetical protein SDC9_156546 [bioreactor metagenome]|uniref:Uncharacterized protein n=1 Tax=bioreactor metagenome TaxID=1076179 RepID=A0A645F500_9ZZZZ